MNSNKEISVYDNTLTARTYIGYIAEQAGGFAVIGRDKKLYIKTFGENIIEFNVDLFKDYYYGDKFKVSKVSYEDGIQNYKFGTDKENTVYINQNNMYIVDEDQIEKIYNQLNELEIYPFEGETIIDPAYDIGDILIIDGKKVIYQGEIEYAGKFKANINSKIEPKTEQESMQTKEDTKKSIKRVQSQINQEEAKIIQLIQESSKHEEKLTEHEQDIEKIKQKISNTIDYKRNIEGVTEIYIENAGKADILKIEVQGNKTYESNLFPKEGLKARVNLYPNQKGG